MTKAKFQTLSRMLLGRSTAKESLSELLGEIGFDDWRAAASSLERLIERFGAQKRLVRALPTILELLETSASPDRALLNLELLMDRSENQSDLLSSALQTPRMLDMLFTIFAGSQFLTDILLRNPEYVHQLSDTKALARPKSRDRYFQEALAMQQGAESYSGKLDALRLYQRQQLWRIGSSDLCNLSALQTVTAQLSYLAIGLIRAGLQIASEEVDIPIDGFTVLALGKLGGRELNYSSDIDLIFISDGRDQPFQKLGQKLIEVLNKFTGEGFLYRTDMRLRPWGSTGKLVPTLEENLSYLQNNARHWEKQAMLKVRIMAGDRGPGEAFYGSVRPMLFKLQPDELRESVVSMKQQIEKKLNRKEWGEVKNGRGSIRDIEFTVQYLQLLHGSESDDIRSRNSLDAMGRLAANGYLAMRDYRTLSEGYIFLRTIEHHLQIMHYQQTHQLPVKKRDVAFLARRLGYEGEGSAAAFLERYEQHREAIRAIYERILKLAEPDKTDNAEPVTPIVELKPPDEADKNRLLAELNENQPVRVQADELEPGIWRLMIVGYDYPGELSLICGLISGFGLNILEGRIETIEDARPKPAALRPLRRRRRSATLSSRRKIFDVFLLRQMKEAPAPDWQAYEQELLKLVNLLREREINATHGLLAARLASVLPDSIESDMRQLPVYIEIDNSASEDDSVLRIDGHDTFGFLYELTNALALNGLNIKRMHITSLGDRIHDTLYVTDLSRQKLLQPEKQQQVRAVVALVKHFTQVLPHTPNPEAAMLHFREFVTQFFNQPDWLSELSSLERPEVFDALVNLLGISDFLWSDFLRMQHDNLFPVVRDIHGLSRLKTADALRGELREQLKGVTEYNEKRRLLNAFKDREMFRIDMRYIEGHIPEFWQFSEELTDLAGVVLKTGLDIAYAHLILQHGKPLSMDREPAECCMVALGKFGGRELGFASDIELMLIYEGDGDTNGGKSLTTPEFYDKLVYELKQLITAKREGIFEIDLRLRPYGNAGRMAVALSEFKSYFTPAGPAWNYERQALVKLRPIWQDISTSNFSERVMAARDDCLFVKGAFDVAAMRAIREKQIRQLVAGGTVNAKYSPGGLVDVEYLVQGLQIINGVAETNVRHPNTGKAMKRLMTSGFLGEDDYKLLKKAHIFLRTLIDALRMVRGNAKDLTVPPPDTKAFTFLARRMNISDTVLQTELQQHTVWLREAVVRLLG